MTWSTRTTTFLAGLAGLALAAACADIAAPDGLDPAFAPGGNGGGGKPPSLTMVGASVDGLGGDLNGDGLGAYVNGTCGVQANFLIRSDGNNGMHFYPAASSSSCPRTATVNMAVRHVSADHSEDEIVPLGDFYVTQIKGNLDGHVMVVNAAQSVSGAPITPCFDIDRRGRVGGGQGMRFDPNTFPGASTIQVTQLGDLHYRMQTRPYPDNIAGCNSNGVLTFWHVDVDLTVQATGN